MHRRRSVEFNLLKQDIMSGLIHDAWLVTLHGSKIANIQGHSQRNATGGKEGNC